MIRKVATRQQRLCYYILARDSSDPENPLLKLSTTSIDLQYRSTLDDTPLYTWRFDPVLLPGGRWLLDCAQDLNDTFIIQCWDLWTNMDEDNLTPALPAAAIDSQLDKLSSWIQQASGNSDEVTLLLNGEDHHADWAYEVIQLTWCSDNDRPIFKRGGFFVNPSLNGSLRVPKANLCGRLITFPYDSQHVVVWDWVSGKSTRMLIGGEDSEICEADLWLQGPYLFFVNESGSVLSRLQVPKLYSRDGNSHPVLYTPDPSTQHSWTLPNLPDSPPTTLRYHSVSHPNCWGMLKTLDYGEDYIWVFIMHAKLEHSDAVDMKLGIGAMAFLSTSIDESKVPQMVSHRADSFPLLSLPELHHSQSSVDTTLHAERHIHPLSRIHSITPTLLASIGHSAYRELNDMYTFQIRSYALSQDGGSSLGSQKDIPTGIVHTPGQKSDRVKVTNAPCSISGIFLASAKVAFRGVYTTQIWLMQFD